MRHVHRFQVILVGFFLCFWAGCTTNQEAIYPLKTEVTTEQLRLMIRSMPEYTQLIDLQRQRFDQVQESIGKLSPLQVATLVQLRDQNISVLSRFVVGTDNQGLVNMFRNDVMDQAISVRLESIYSKLASKYIFKNQVFLDAMQQNTASARVAGDCSANSASEIYHMTYYTLKWEMGMTEESATIGALFAEAWYLQGCKEGAQK